jgi:hypothetical protein
VNNVKLEPQQPEFFMTEKEIVHNCLLILNKIYIDRIETFFTHPLFENIVRTGLARIDSPFL